MPETRDSLLARILVFDDQEAWDEFVRLYHPIIYRMSRARGLQDSDALDLAQRVLLSVARSAQTWEKNSPDAKFRHWLRKVIRNAIINELSRRPLDRGPGGTTNVDRLHEAEWVSKTTQEFELEYRRELFLRAVQMIRNDFDPDTWRAFESTVLDNQPIEVASRELAKSVGSIYAARSRVTQRLRETVKYLETLE